MEYVADELGVELLRLPVLQRELSVRADPAAILALRDGSSGSGARTSSTPTPRRPAPPAGSRRCPSGRRPAARDRPHLPRPRPQRLLQPALGAGLPLDRACARAHVRDADRRQRRGARRPRRASASRRRSRFVVVPYGFDLPPWSEADDEARRAMRAEIGAGEETFVVGWAGRLTAIKRPLDLIRTLRALRDDRASTRCSCSSGTARTAPAVEALAAELGVADRCRLVGFQKSIRPWYASFDALAADVGERGHARRRDRGARRRAAGRRDPRRRHGDGRQERRERLPRVDRRHGRAGGAARDAGPRPRAARAARARTAPRTCGRVSRSGGWPTRSRRSTAGCCA